MKKRYIKPSIIDLSIEGMTGFGYGVLSANCLTGTDFSLPTCEKGYGANSSCSGGESATNTCSDGAAPSDKGTFCETGSSANGRGCLYGDFVSGFNPACDEGGVGFNINAADCELGPTANFCWHGNSNVGPFS